MAKVLGPDWKQKEHAAVDVLTGALLKGIPLQVRLDVGAVLDEAAAAIEHAALRLRQIRQEYLMAQTAAILAAPTRQPTKGAG